MPVCGEPDDVFKQALKRAHAGYRIPSHPGASSEWFAVGHQQKKGEDAHQLIGATTSGVGRKYHPPPAFSASSFILVGRWQASECLLIVTCEGDVAHRPIADTHQSQIDAQANENLVPSLLSRRPLLHYVVPKLPTKGIGSPELLGP